MLLIKNRYKLAPLIFLFIGFDILCTLHWYTAFGQSIESNPVGIFLLQYPIFLILKLIVSGFILFELDYRANNNLFNLLRRILFSSYTALAIYHIIIFISIDTNLF